MHVALPDPVVQALTVSSSSIVPLATSLVPGALRGQTFAGSVLPSGELVCDFVGATRCTSLDQFGFLAVVDVYWLAAPL
eukprot:4645936-Pyramimonas_sp.AAC.1